jgi:hypothetical protein
MLTKSLYCFLEDTSSVYLLVYFPYEHSLEILRYLGLVHVIKSRSISCSKFLYFEDTKIIKSFGYICYVFLIWFRCCKNFLKVKAFINLIRQSCFLTLARKHNKSKAWAYKIYTSDCVMRLHTVIMY